MEKYIDREKLIKAVCRQYQGDMNTFFAKPNDFIALIEDQKILKPIKTGVVREIFEEICGITDLFAQGLIDKLEFYDILAELKKKYTEGNNDKS